MPWVKISSEAHKDMKQYLVDIDDLNLGQLVEAAFEFCMENLEKFDEFLGLDDTDEGTAEKEDVEDQEEETENEEQ